MNDPDDYGTGIFMLDPEGTPFRVGTRHDSLDETLPVLARKPEHQVADTRGIWVSDAKMRRDPREYSGIVSAIPALGKTVTENLLRLRREEPEVDTQAYLALGEQAGMLMGIGVMSAFARQLSADDGISLLYLQKTPAELHAVAHVLQKGVPTQKLLDAYIAMFDVRANDTGRVKDIPLAFSYANGVQTGVRELLSERSRTRQLFDVDPQEIDRLLETGLEGKAASPAQEAYDFLPVAAESMLATRGLAIASGQVPRKAYELQFDGHVISGFPISMIPTRALRGRPGGMYDMAKDGALGVVLAQDRRLNTSFMASLAAAVMQVATHERKMLAALESYR